ncbi:MAG: CopG family transcriptional regulator [Ignisphaera sp.]
MVYVDAVFSVKIRKEVKEKMEKYRDSVNWAEEIRRYIEEILRKLEAQENFEKILKELEKARWGTPKGFVVSSVKEDRDSS